ncbi:MAG: hypothetical protein QOJ64_3202 [Acidobacteriota bacterium]|jgi:DNA-binding winged helix-turn-helix (wHTH) protein|nr:hypothetical protein [Acidobacteriota bacterium]
MSKPVNHSYVFDRYRLSIKGKELLYEDHTIPLNRMQFEILQILVENHGEFVKKDRLVTEVCGNSTAGPNTIEQAILSLRGKLHDGSKESRFIETKRGVGYRFIAAVRIVGDEDSDSYVMAEGAAGEDSTTAVDAAYDATGPAPSSTKHLVAEGSASGMLTFQDWRRGPGQLVKWVLIGGVMATVSLSIAGVIGKWDNDRTMLMLSIAQFFILLFALVYTLFLRVPIGFLPVQKNTREENRLDKDMQEATGYEDAHEWDEAREIAKTALERYTVYWYGVLGTWLLLYACLAFKGLPNLGLSSQALSIVTTLFNNCNTVLVILCFHILNKPMGIKPRRRGLSDTALSIVSVTFVFAFLVIEILLVNLPATIGEESARYGLNLASGIAGGIAMALYVGRLQSKFLGPSPRLVIALYSYTAIQSLFVFLVEGPEAKVVSINAATVTSVAVILINVALILKCLLYLYMAWLFQSGRLLFYFVRVRRTYQRVETEWQEFRKLLDEET